MNKILSKWVICWISLLYGKTSAPIGFLGNKFTAKAKWTALSLCIYLHLRRVEHAHLDLFTMCVSQMLCCLCCSRIKHLIKGDVWHALDFGQNKKKGWSFFSSLNMDCVFIFNYRQHLVFWILIFKILPFKVQCCCLHIIAVLAGFWRSESCWKQLLVHLPHNSILSWDWVYS